MCQRTAFTKGSDCSTVQSVKCIPFGNAQVDLKEKIRYKMNKSAWSEFGIASRILYTKLTLKWNGNLFHFLAYVRLIYFLSI
jgi:hypothetical protein